MTLNEMTEAEMVKSNMHWLWRELGRNRRIFGSEINKFYGSDVIQGYIHNGNPIGIWIFKNAETNKTIEEKMFIR